MIEVDREPGARPRSESLDNASLRPYVKDVGSGDEIDIPIQEEAQLPVTLVCTATRAIECRIVEKAPKPTAAACAADLVTTERDGNDSKGTRSGARSQPPRHEVPRRGAETMQKHLDTIVGDTIVGADIAGTLRP